MSKDTEENNLNEENNAEESVEDIIFEEEGETPKDTVKQLREKLKTCQKERQEFLDGWQRAQADVQNTKRQAQEEKDAFSKYAKEGVIHDILPVIDSFDFAFANKQQWEEVSENWRKGVEYIYTQLKETLAQHGVQEINPVGEVFDPKIHDSAETIETEDESKDNTVAEIVQKGYQLHDKIIRPARVKVYTFKP